MCPNTKKCDCNKETDCCGLKVNIIKGALSVSTEGYPSILSLSAFPRGGSMRYSYQWEIVTNNTYMEFVGDPTVSTIKVKLTNAWRTAGTMYSYDTLIKVTVIDSKGCETTDFYLVTLEDLRKYAEVIG